MKPTLETRKPIDEICVADLVTFPIWEFASDEEEDEEQDETWVRPVSASCIPVGAYSLSVYAKFVTSSGVELEGIVDVTTAEGFEANHAALITPDSYVFVPWPEMEGALIAANEAAKELGLEVEELFPLTYRLAVSVEGEVKVREGEYRYAKSDV